MSKQNSTDQSINLTQDKSEAGRVYRQSVAAVSRGQADDHAVQFTFLNEAVDQFKSPEKARPRAPLPMWQGLLQLAAVIGVILCALLGLFSQDRTAMWLWLAAAAACLILRLTLALIRRRAMRDDAPPQT